MSPRLYPDPPFRSYIQTWQGLFQWYGDAIGWRCVRGCAARPGTLQRLEWPRAEAREEYPEIGRFAQPFFWAGLWFLGWDGNWHIAKWHTNYGPDFV